MIRSFYQKRKPFLQKLDGLFLSNTVLDRGLVVAPVIVSANSLKHAAGIGIVFAIVTFFSVLLASFMPRRIPFTIRVIVNVLIAAVVYIPAFILVEKLLPGIPLTLGIYLPLLVTNSLIVRKSETRFHKEKRLPMIIDLISHIIGFLWVVFLVGFLRELFGSGMVWGKQIALTGTAPAMLMPFFGFILCGFLSAGMASFKRYLAKYEPRQSAEKEEDKNVQLFKSLD